MALLVPLPAFFFLRGFLFFFFFFLAAPSTPFPLVSAGASSASSSSEEPPSLSASWAPLGFAADVEAAVDLWVPFARGNQVRNVG